MKPIALITLAFLLTTAACKGPKKIQTAIGKVDTVAVIDLAGPSVDSAAIKLDILNRVKQNHIDYNTFSGKIKLDYANDKGKNTDANIFVRMRKDSLIWVSLTGALGIEGYRVLVTPDSVWLMNKLEKTMTRKSVSYLQEVIKLPVSFEVLQDMLLGNPVYFPPNIVSYKNNGNTLLALSVGEYFKHLLTLDTTTNTILRSKLDDVDALRNRTCDITLSDYKNVQNRNFSHLRQITVTEKTKLNITLEYKQVDFDLDQSYPFNIPKNYQLK